MARVDRRHSAAGGPPGRGRAGGAGHPSGPGRRPAARRGQDDPRPRHLRPGRGHPLGDGRRRGHCPPLGADPGLHPPGRPVRALPRARRGPADAGRQRRRSSSPGPGSTTCPRPTGPCPSTSAGPCRPPTTPAERSDQPGGRRPRAVRARATTSAALALGLGGPLGEEGLGGAGVGVQLAVAGLDGAQQLDDGLGGVGLERAVLACSPRPPPRASRPVAAARIDSRLDTPGRFSRVVADLGAGVGDRPLDLLLDDRRVVEQEDGALGRVARTSTSCRSGLCRSMTRAPALRDGGLGHHEGLAVAAVEALGDVAGELEVLALVVAHRDPVGVVAGGCRRPSARGR